MIGLIMITATIRMAIMLMAVTMRRTKMIVGITTNDGNDKTDQHRNNVKHTAMTKR